MLTVITPTGARSEAFAICHEQMRRQKIDAPVLWLVIDDGPEPQHVPPIDGWRIETLRPKPLWDIGQNTHGRNLLAGIRLARDILGDDENIKIAFVEDDDCYAPQWLQTVYDNLHTTELFGECPARYYMMNAAKFATLKNHRHSCLRCTGITGPAIGTFIEVLKTPQPFYDVWLWHTHRRQRLAHTQLTVGVKGLPGRAGITEAHRKTHGTHDAGAKIAKQWFGDSWELFKPYWKNPKEDKMSDERPWITPTVGYFHEGKARKPGRKYQTCRSEANILCNLLKKAEYSEAGAEPKKAAPVLKPKKKKDTDQKTEAPKKDEEKQEEKQEYKTRDLKAGLNKLLKSGSEDKA